MKNLVRTNFIKTSLVLMMLTFCAHLHAQELSPEIVTTGTVTAEDTNEPLPGVNVLIKGTTTGTITDINGNYSIKAPDNGILVFSFIGYAAEEVPVNNQTNVDVVMVPDVQSLQEVVVVAYGTQRKEDVTGSISTVSAQEMEDLPVGQFAQKLQGKIPGVQISQATGRPGQGMSFRIRGSASLNATNGPLFVVDGQPIVGGINNINPDAIESFTVLKDAAATSLYGSRGANGVVMVTTKQAKKGETHIAVNAYYGIQQVPQRGRPEVMNAREFAQYKKEFYEDKIRYENWVNPATGTAEVPDEFKNPGQYGEGTNWFNTLIRNAPIQNYSLSVSSGGDKFSSSVTAGYFNQEGVLHNTGYERFSFRANNKFTPNDKLTLGFNIAPSFQLDHNTRTNTDGNWQIIQAAFMTTPLEPAVNPDGSMPLTATSTGMFPNPNWYRVLLERQDDYKTTRLLANAYLELELFEGLKFKTRADVDMGGEVHQNFIPSTSVGALFVAPPQPATGFYGTYNYTSWVNENTLTYNAFINDHSIEALVGYTAQRVQSETSGINGTDFPSDDISWLNNAATITDATSNTSSWSLLSMIGRVNYNYKGKYMLSAAARRDGSSRFGMDRKWGWFPSVSAGWIISDEPFMQDINPLNYLKIRSSYGLTGNFNIGNYTAIAGIGTTDYVFGGVLVPGKSITVLGNSELGWETTSQFDIGLDLGLFKDRIFLVYDYYQKRTEDMLYPIELPRASGFPSIQYNIGTFEFWGHEIGINTRNLVGEFKWNTHFNISFNRNRVVKLGTNDTPIGGYRELGDYWRTEVGHPMGQFFGYVFDGVYMTQQAFDSQPKHATSDVGTVRMADLNKDGVIDINDRTFIGNPNPEFVFGLTNDFRYKNFDLNIVVSGAVGGDVMDASYEFLENLDGVFNVRKEVAHQWRSEEDPGNGSIPRTKAGTTALFRSTSSRWVFDGSYATIKNITLGYTLPIDHAYIKSMRVYGSVQQALVITDYPGINPEVSSNGLNGLSQGLDFTTYPVPRTFTLGVNVNF